jgi:hypothetical protein
VLNRIGWSKSMSVRAASLLCYALLLAISLTNRLNAQTATSGGLMGSSPIRATPWCLMQPSKSEKMPREQFRRQKPIEGGLSIFLSGAVEILPEGEA